jgi:hypothetical protein
MLDAYYELNQQMNTSLSLAGSIIVFSFEPVHYISGCFHESTWEENIINRSNENDAECQRCRQGNLPGDENAKTRRN